MRYELYKFVMMPLRSTNTLVVFIDMMNKVFQDYLNNFIVVFIDDIIVYSKTQEEYE